MELSYSPHRTAEATRNLFEFSVTNRHGPQVSFDQIMLASLWGELWHNARQSMGTNIRPLVDTML